MKYSMLSDKSVYLAHVCYIPAAVVLISAFALWLMFRELWTLRLARQNKKQQALLIVLIIAVGVGLLYPLFQTLRFGIFLPFEESSSVMQSEGDVETVEPCLYSPRYYLDETGKISRPYLISVDGKQYFCVNGDLLKQGDIISFFHYPKSSIIVSFQKITQGQVTVGGTQKRSFDYWAALFSLAMICAAALFGYRSASHRKKPMNTDEIAFVPGDLLFERGIGMIILVFVVMNIAWLTIPGVRDLKYIVFILPFLAVLMIREIPVTYKLEGKKVDKLLFGWLRIRCYDLSSIDKAICGSGTFGSIMILLTPDVNGQICRSMVSLFLYHIGHRKQVLLFPIKTNDEFYARSIFSEKLGLEVKYVVW